MRMLLLAALIVLGHVAEGVKAEDDGWRRSGGVTVSVLPDRGGDPQR